MNNIEHVLDTIINNPLYLILTASLAIMIIWSLIKKLYKLAIIFGICSIVYVVYIYIENPKEAQEKIQQGLDDLGKKIPIPKEATKNIQEAAKEAKQSLQQIEGKVKGL